MAMHLEERAQQKAMERWAKRVLELIAEGGVEDKASLSKVKGVAAGETGLSFVPRDSDLLALLGDSDRERLVELLRVKPTRTRSGVAVVAVMTSPEDCPHGQCVPCPGGKKEGVPQSYTGFEPAARRAIAHGFDPYKQVTARLNQLEETGHVTHKIDLIIMGGTFTARPWSYQEDFVKGCYDGLNGIRSEDLGSSIKLNETARHRCIGLTVETRPDHFTQKEVAFCRDYGATRVELGVQSINDDVLDLIERGHGVSHSIEATKLAKEAGMKVCYHMMPGLPKTTMGKDAEDILALFSNPSFCPDMLKIYPTLVVPGSKLHSWWERGDYQPPKEEETASMLARVKPRLPPYVRIQRIERDIPVDKISAGIRRSDLRMLVKDEMQRSNKSCNCIRCREAGLSQKINTQFDYHTVSWKTHSYEASGGKELFISFEEEGVLYGYTRLRLDALATVRELKVLGGAVAIGKTPQKGSSQHQGMGSRLLEICEMLSKDEGYDQLRITAGVGVREYYRGANYILKGTYMVKELA